MFEEIRKIMGKVEFGEKLTSLGLNPYYTPPSQFGAMRKSDMARYAKIIKASNTKQPPAKAGGFELRTGSPDTRRLNDASYGGSILKSSLGLGSK